MAQVSNETAVLELALMIKYYDDSNPDIGWGIGAKQCVDQATERLGLQASDIDYDIVVAEFSIRTRRTGM